MIEQVRTSFFDILLTDIQMTAINGFDLVKLLRASNIPQAKTIPVIAVTARSEMDIDALQEHGFAGCLHKPFTVKELLLTVNEGQLAADEAHITEDMQTVSSLNFSALTAFSEDDADAAHSIIQTFIEETGKNADRMQQGGGRNSGYGSQTTSAFHFNRGNGSCAFIELAGNTTWAMFFRGDR